MDIKLRILGVSVGVMALIISLLNVRRRRLSEHLALFWIILSLFLILFAIKFNWIVKISDRLGIIDPNNFVFFLGLVFLVLISFYFSIEISRLRKQYIILAQENALLKKEKEEKKD